jgi:hypothetical protein
MVFLLRASAYLNSIASSHSLRGTCVPQPTAKIEFGLSGKIVGNKQVPSLARREGEVVEIEQVDPAESAKVLTRIMSEINQEREKTLRLSEDFSIGVDRYTQLSSVFSTVVVIMGCCVDTLI